MRTILALRDQAEAATVVAEEANRKANSESGFAYNAKQNAEDHAKAIAQLRGSAEADVNWLNTTKRNVDEMAAAIATSSKTAEVASAAAVEAKTSCEAEFNSIKDLRQGLELLLSEAGKSRDDAASSAKRAADDLAVVGQA
ncbi:MAG: hypothetical protein ACRD2N_16295, partial [Vicinamibacterales bacterium]